MIARLQFLLLCLLATGAMAQQDDLPVVSARGGSTSVNWPQVKKEEDADKDGPGFFYRDCAQGVGSPKASSFLPAQGSRTYVPSNLNDGDPMSAWVEGKPGYGIGEWFGVSAPTVNSIFNGYQATPTAWKNNSRVKKLKVLMDNEDLCILVLEDKMGEQTFDLPMEVDWNKTHEFRFVILEVYKGLKFDDVAISHVDFNGCCVAEGTWVDAAVSTSVESIQVGSTVTTIDVVTGNATVAVVTRVTSVAHDNLWRIRTSSGELVLTADHPLLFRDRGFKSVSWIKAGDRIEVVKWSSPGKFAYEPVLSIEPVAGTMITYSIRGLSQGSTYVVNGFVTKVY